uniref:SH3 domain-containing protein n=1 Tax=Candidatus Cryptobacteroides bacterium TaxID=3085639 RepID=UPI0040259D95
MASYDQFGRVIRSAPAPQLDIPIRPSYSYSYNSYSTPWYQRFWYWLDNSISSIGNFIARNGESFANITVGIGIWILAIGLVWWVISHWISDGFLWAILYGFGAVLMFGAGSFCLGIISWILQLVIAALRLAFWNALSLIGVLAVVLTLLCVNGYSNSSNHSSYANSVETVVPTYSTYRCTASVLNVRTAPNTYSRVLGTLKRGQTIDVIETTGGFAKVSYGGRTGYASLKYLERM